MTLKEILDQLGHRRVALITLAILIRPWLWPSALRFAPPGWWRHQPFLPVPPPEYLKFRLETAYGDNWDKAAAADTIKYLRWCRASHKYSRTRSHDDPRFF